MSPRRGKLTGAKVKTEPSTALATAKPSTPPASAINTLSLSNCWTSLARVAPKALLQFLHLRTENELPVGQDKVEAAMQLTAEAGLLAMEIEERDTAFGSNGKLGAGGHL